MYNRYTRYRRVTDGRTDRQTDRQTSCHGIVHAMHTRRAVKMLIVKIQTVINCLQLSDIKTRDVKNDVISDKLVLSFYGWILKTWQGKNDGAIMGKFTRGKINAIWWNIKVNLQKLVGIGLMWIWITNKFAKFHAKRLNRSQNIPKRFRGNYFWNTLYSLYVSWSRTIDGATVSRLRIADRHKTAKIRVFAVVVISCVIIIIINITFICWQQFQK